MTEKEWLECSDPRKMLESIGWKVSERKLRLLACACCRRLWHLFTDKRSRRAVNLAEVYADGLVSRTALDRARKAARSADVPNSVESRRAAAAWYAPQKVPLPRVTRREIHPLTPEQVSQFLDATVLEGFYYPLYVLALDSGARWGELAALERGDVDLEAGTVSITKSLEESNGERRVKETKTKASRRRIKLSNFTVDVLREYLETKPGNRIFSTRDGGYLMHTHVSRAFRAHIKKAGLSGVRFHDLRHTMATLLLLAGVHVKVVSERLGHSRIQVTLDTYSHVLPSMQEAAALAIGGFLGSKKSEGSN
jgi:integrase